MKKILLFVLAASLTGLVTIPAAQASECRYSSSYCAPYRVSTCEIGRCSYTRSAYDDCGRRYCYNETVVTYRSVYSDGSSRTFSRTFRS